MSYSRNGAKGNPWVESMWSRIKAEIGSLITEARDLGELEEIMNRHMDYYNTQRRHSAIDYQTPWSFLEQQMLGKDVAAD